MSSSLIKIKLHIIESACRNAVAKIEKARLEDKIHQVDLIMKEEASFIEKILGRKPKILNREDAENDLMEYAEKSQYMPEKDFYWYWHDQTVLSYAKSLLDIIGLCDDDTMLLTIEDAKFISKYSK